MDRGSITAYQEHLGSGNNEITFKDSNIENFEFQQVTRRVIELAPDNIRQSVSRAIEFISHGRQQDADLIISTLELTNSLDHEAHTALWSLKALSAKTPDPEVIKALLENKSSCQNPFVLDLIVAAQIRSDVISENFDSALERYQNTSLPGNLTKTFFLKWLASYDDILCFYNANKLDLTDQTLIAVTYGYLRVVALEDAISVVDRLSAKRDLPHISKLFYFCNAARLNDIFSKQHYWTISLDDKSIVNNVIEESKSYLKSKYIDKKIINVVSACLNNTGFEDDALVELCLSDETTLNLFSSEIKEQLQYIKSEDPKVFSDEELIKVLGTKSDSKVRASVADRIANELKLSSFQFLNIQSILNKSQLSELLSMGLTVDSDDEFTINVCELRLRLIASDDSADLTYITNLANKVLESIEKDGLKIQPPLLLDIAKGLQENKIFQQTIQLIESALSNEMWLSPLYDYYLDFLFQIRQYHKLTLVLNSIPQAVWSFKCWTLYINLLQINGDLKKEIESIELLLKHHEDNISVWCNLISAYERANESSKIANLASQIPDILFDKPTDEAWRALFSLMRQGLFKFVESIALRWFIDDPDGISQAITNFVLSGTFNDVHYDFSETIDNISSCYVLKNIDNKEITKLLVQGYKGSHPNILDTDSPIGKILKHGSLGDKVTIGFNDYKIIEIVPPFLGAAWRIAPKLRTQQNDGRDAFQLIEFEDNNVSNSIASIISKINLKNEPDKIKTHPYLPIQIKAHWSGRHNLLESIIDSILDKECIKNNLPATSIKSGNIALDLSAIVFISLTSLYLAPSFIKKTFFITSETKQLLTIWLEQANKAHLKASVNEAGRLVLSDENHLINQRLIRGLEYLINISRVSESDLYDYPLELLKYEDHIDTSTLSTVLCSYQNDYKYLSIDNNFVQLFKDEDISFYSTSCFYLELFNELSVEQQLDSLALSYGVSLKVPIEYKTLANLAFLNTTDSISLVTTIVQYWKGDNQDDNFFNLLSVLAISGIRFSLLSKNIIDRSIGEKLFFRMLRCALNTKGKSMFVEDNFTALSIKILERTMVSDQLFNYTVLKLKSFVLSHFLDTSYIDTLLYKHFAEKNS